MHALKEIGKTLKPHGLRGELKFVLNTLYQELPQGIEAVFLESKGAPVPFFIESIRSEQPMIIKLEGVDTPEAAKALAHKPLFVPENLLPETQEPELESDLKGYFLKDKTAGVVGEILRTEEFPQQLMAVIAYENREIYIPLAEGLVVDLNNEEKSILMDLPEGILDL